MKKKYQKPEIELTDFAVLDVIARGDEIDDPLEGTWGSDIW